MRTSLSILLASRSVESLAALTERDQARDIQSCVRLLQRGGESARYGEFSQSNHLHRSGSDKL